MWWILVPALAVLASAALALTFRGRYASVRVDRSADEADDDRPFR